MPKGISNPNKGKGKAYAWLVAHLNHAGEECLIWPLPWYRASDQGQGSRFSAGTGRPNGRVSKRLK